MIIGEGLLPDWITKWYHSKPAEDELPLQIVPLEPYGEQMPAVPEVEVPDDQPISRAPSLLNVRRVTALLNYGRDVIYHNDGLGFVTRLLQKPDGTFHDAKWECFGHMNRLFVSDPVLMRQVLKEGRNGVYTGGTEHYYISKIIGETPLTAFTEETHAKLRKSAMESPGSFNYCSVKERFADVQKVIRRHFEERWPLQQELNGTENIRLCVHQSMVLLLLGTESQFLDAPKHLKNAEEILTSMLKYEHLADPQFNSKREKICKELQKIVQGLRENPADGLAAQMAQQLDENGEFLYSDEEINHMILLILFVGLGTTASHLTSALYHLSENPEEQQNFRSEVDCLPEEYSHSDLQKCEAIQHLISETLRIAPPVWIQVRQAQKEVTLENSSARYIVPKGTTLFLSQYHSNRNPKLWGEDAEQFRPSRFQDGNHTNVFAPFSIGINRCIGQHSARLIASIFLVELAKRGHFIRTEEQPISYKAGFSLTFERDVRIRIEEV